MGSTFLIIVVLKWIVTTRRCRLAMTRQIAIPCPQPSNREPEFRAEKLPKMMAVMAVALTHSVWAQVPSPGAESGALQEIIVTAQRREESIQQAPMSVTVLTGQMLQDFGVRDFQDYAKAVANLSFGMGGSPTGGPAYGYSSTREIIIRGVSGPNTTSLYIDDTPIPNVMIPGYWILNASRSCAARKVRFLGHPRWAAPLANHTTRRHGRYQRKGDGASVRHQRRRSWRRCQRHTEHPATRRCGGTAPQWLRLLQSRLLRPGVWRVHGTGRSIPTRPTNEWLGQNRRDA